MVAGDQGGQRQGGLSLEIWDGALEEIGARAENPLTSTSQLAHYANATTEQSQIAEGRGTFREWSMVQLGGNQEPTQKSLKRLAYLLATELRLYWPFVVRSRVSKRPLRSNGGTH